jgi:beta-lactamase family protein/uncharacterized protein DUF3471
MTFHPLHPRARVGRALLALFAIAFVIAPPAWAAVSNAELARYADQLFSRAYPAGEPGAAVLVAQDGQVLLRKGYGMANLELGVPIQPDMVFEIGSITKQFTAAAILREGGKLFTRRNGGEKEEIQAASRDDFFSPESGGRFQFWRDAQGKIVGLNSRQRFGPADAALKTAEPLPAERREVKVDPALYDGYVGVYELAPGFLLTVTREGDHLMTQATGQPKVEVFPESESKFFLKVVDAQIEFQRGSDGKATGLMLYQGGRVVPAKKVR